MKKKQPKKMKVGAGHQLYSFLDLVLSKVAFSGKSYKGVFQLPLEEVSGLKQHAGVVLSLRIIAKCDGDFGEEYAAIDIDPNEDGH